MILTWGDATDYRIRDCRGRSQRERRLSPIESPDAISAQPLAISKLLALLILIALGLKDVLDRVKLVLPIETRVGQYLEHGFTEPPQPV